jgi:hypothetical protein
MMEWISVNDRLPEEFSNVLVARSCGVVCECTVDIDGEFAFEYELGLRRYTAKPLSDVTHWMPLPSPPTELNNSESENVTIIGSWADEEVVQPALTNNVKEKKQ